MSLSRNATGREFQRDGPTTEKLLSPRRVRVWRIRPTIPQTTCWVGLRISWPMSVSAVSLVKFQCPIVGLYSVHCMYDFQIRIRHFLKLSFRAHSFQMGIGKGCLCMRHYEWWLLLLETRRNAGVVVSCIRSEGRMHTPATGPITHR